MMSAFKMPNKQIVLLILTRLIQRKHMKNYAYLRDGDVPVATINGSDPRKPKRIFFEFSKNQITDTMGACLKAVSHFFEGKKSFKNLMIYLRLAFKLFVCVGAEGS